MSFSHIKSTARWTVLSVLYIDIPEPPVVLLRSGKEEPCFFLQGLGLDAPALLVLGLGDDAAQSRLCGGEILFARLLLRLLLERFQLVEHGLRRHARVLEDIVRLAACTLHHLIRPFLGGVALGAHLIALGLGGAPHALRLLLHLLDAAALALKLSQNVLKACILGRNLLLRAVDDDRLKAETRRDGEGVGLAGGCR